MVGTTDYNVDLSQRRADAIAAALRYRLPHLYATRPRLLGLAGWNCHK